MFGLIYDAEHVDFRLEQLPYVSGLSQRWAVAQLIAAAATRSAA